jgi:hypothetical protein
VCGEWPARIFSSSARFTRLDQQAIEITVIILLYSLRDLRINFYSLFAFAHVIRNPLIAYNRMALMATTSLMMQTTYAELVQRCAATAFQDAFAEDGAFVSKEIKGNRYWYFQQSSNDGRVQKYVGPETPELLEKISNHKQARNDERERRALVSTLVRTYGLPRPIPEFGSIIAALAKAGVFRLHGVLVGTAAYQTYSAMLGTKLPISIQQTGDVDIAQFEYVSVAVGDKTPPVLEVLKEVDETFRPVPHAHHERNVTSYRTSGGLGVDFLTPNEGPDTDVPKRLPALQTDAEPLRFLDYLIREPESAVILHEAGVYVLVPAPERYAVHKLVVSRRRRAGAAKQQKDIQQSAALLDLLAQKRPYELKTAWKQGYARGRKTWRQLLGEGLGQLPAAVRDRTLKVIDEHRDITTGLNLTFNNSAPKYDQSRDIVTFGGEALAIAVSCAISREALDDNFGTAGTSGRSNEERLETFRKNRSAIERMARHKYLFWPVEEIEAVLIKTEDIPKLVKEAAQPTTGRH